MKVSMVITHPPWRIMFYSCLSRGFAVVNKESFLHRHTHRPVEKQHPMQM